MSYLLLLLISSALAYDCSKFQPFTPLEMLKADVNVYRFFKIKPDGTGEEVDEEICSSSQPLLIPLKDIRGREADWYYCNKHEPTEYLICDVSYKALPAKLHIRPAMVIRQWKPTDALDTHIHVYLEPEGDSSRYLDNFTQAISYELSLRNITLNGGAGGRGPKADQDYYYVRLKFYR